MSIRRLQMKITRSISPCNAAVSGLSGVPSCVLLHDRDGCSLGLPRYKFVRILLGSCLQWAGFDYQLPLLGLLCGIAGLSLGAPRTSLPLLRHCYSGHRRDAVRLEERLDDGMYARAGGRVCVTAVSCFTLSILWRLKVAQWGRTDNAGTSDKPATHRYWISGASEREETHRYRAKDQYAA